MVCAATHLADCLAKDTRESVNDLHCRVKAGYQTPVVIAILFERLLSFLE